MANEKILNTRILLKTDTLEAWNSSTLPLKKGEIAIATVAATAGNGLSEPVCMIKIGEDGVKTFKDLPWNFYAKASDVIAEAKSAETLETFVNGVIAKAGIATDEAMKALAARVTTAEGEIDALQADLNTEGTGLKARVATAEGAIDALEDLVGDTKVATQIANAITELNLTDTYAAKTHGHEIAEVNGLSDSIAAAKKAGTDANAALEAYKTTNDAAVKVVSDAITGIKNGETLDNFKEVEEALAGKQAVGDYATKTEAQGYANAKDAAIQAAQKAADDAAAAASAAQADADALEGLVGGTKVSDQISTAITNLDLANTYAPKTHSHTKAEITDFAHNHEMAEVNGLVDALAGKQVAGDYATKAEAQGYANAKDEAIAAAMAAADKAQEEVDALETYVGTIPSDEKYADITNVIAYINKKAEETLASAQGGSSETAASVKAALDTYKAENDPKVQANTDAIDALEKLVGETAVAEQISGAIENALKVEVDGEKVEKYALATALATEVETARAAEKANADAIKVLNGDAETAGSVDYKVAQAVAAIMENPDETMNSINELVTWVNDHAEDALEMSNQVAANKTALETLNGDATKDGSVDKKIADAIAAENLGQYATDGELSALAGRVTTIETEHNTENTGLKTRLTQAEADIDALETKVGDKTVAAQIEAAIEALKIGDYAKAADLTAAINQHNTDKATLEAAIAKKADDSALAAIAKTGSTDDLVQGTMTLVFDCGGAGV